MAEATAAHDPGMTAAAPPADAFTAEELAAMKAVRSELVAADMASQIHTHTLAVVTLNCKLDVAKAVGKYKELVNMLNEFGLASVQDALFSDYDADFKALREGFESFAVAGKDKEGRAIFWIVGKPIEEDEEQQAIRVSLMYYLALHSDFVTLRNGITFVVDVSGSERKVGNERKMQQAWQRFPLRPQTINIIGSSLVQRVFLTALLKIISVFTSDKVIRRVKFTTVDSVIGPAVNPEQAPTKYGGTAAGDTHGADWTRGRLGAFEARLPNLGTTSDI